MKRKHIIAYICLWWLTQDTVAETFGATREEVDSMVRYLVGRGYLIPSRDPRYPSSHSITPSGCEVFVTLRKEATEAGLTKARRLETRVGEVQYSPDQEAIRAALALPDSER